MAKKKQTPKKKNKKAGAGGKIQIMLIFFIILSAVFLPTAFVMFIGLLPMFVAFFVDRSRKKYKAVTVGAMNLAGCMPFLLELWTTDHTLDRAFSIILNPMAIIVIYAAAVVGYIIDWLLGIMVASFLYDRGVSRKAAIEKRQQDLIERWGKEVTGSLPLDEQGFPIGDTGEAAA
jgi:hypothetical protein